MSFIKMSKLVISINFVLTILLCTGAIAVGAYSSETLSGGNGADKAGHNYSERYSANPEAYIGAKGIDGKWAYSTSIEGTTYQEQLDKELTYLESIYQEKDQSFIVEEGIALDEVTKSDGIQYMYDTSSTYRELVTPQDILYIAPESSFSVLADDGKSPIYERHVFYLDNPSELELSVSYKLEQGKMAVWIVAPDGEIIYKNEACSSFNQTIQQSLEKGIYSVVLVSEMDNNHLKGDKFIQGNLSHGTKGL